MPLVRFRWPSCLWCMLGADPPSPRVAPFYDAASIVNAADNQSGALAPNTIGTIYGTNLSYSTAALTGNDVDGGVLPSVLGASETTVFINNIPADLYYVSPGQINFLVPPNLCLGPPRSQSSSTACTARMIQFTLTAAAPGLFQLDATHAVATLADGTVLTPSSPAQPGDIVSSLGHRSRQPPRPPPGAHRRCAPCRGRESVHPAQWCARASWRDRLRRRRPGFRRSVSNQPDAARVHPANPEIRLQLDGDLASPRFTCP